MVDPQKIVEGVQFNPDFNTASLQFNDRLGFLTVPQEYSGQPPAKLASFSLRLLGFGASRSREGGFDMGDSVRPLVHFNDLHPADRTIDKQGKGVGPRLYNTPQAALGLTDIPEEFGAFLFDVDPHTLLDTRRDQGNTVTRIGRHAGRILRSKIFKLENVVNDIHESFDGADAVLYSQPPRAAIRQINERQAPDTEGVSGEFIIVRNEGITLHKVGTYITSAALK